MTRRATARHPFVDSGERRLGPGGSRRFAVCATCGGLKIGTGHVVSAPAPAPVSVDPRRPWATVAGRAPAPAPRPAPSWRVHLLRHAVELALEHRDELDPVLEERLRDTARAVRSALYGTAELVPPPELPVEPEPEREPSLSSSNVTPLANARVRKVAHGFRSPRARELFLRAVRDGHRWQRTSSGHVLIHGPTGEVSLSMSVDERNARSWQNARAAARRAGLDVTGL